MSARPREQQADGRPPGTCTDIDNRPVPDEAKRSLGGAIGRLIRKSAWVMRRPAMPQTTTSADAITIHRRHRNRNPAAATAPKKRLGQMSPRDGPAIAEVVGKRSRHAATLQRGVERPRERAVQPMFRINLSP